MSKILNIKNLEINFNTCAGNIKPVRNINFHLNKGETLVIVGESGCGKSVTAKSIVNLLPENITNFNSNSKIIYKNENILSLNENQLSHIRGKEISMIFQDPMTFLNPTMTIGDQIGESITIHNKKINKKNLRNEVLNILNLVRIPTPEKRFNQYPHEFSGGMQQRIIIAIALACKPNILIADEPTTALDVTIQADILDLLMELQDNLKMSIILITHDLGVAAEIADRIQVMYAGEIVEAGTKKEIFTNPKHPYTKALLKSVPSIDNNKNKKLYSLSGCPPDLLLNNPGCSFAPRCEYCMKVCLKHKPENHIISDTHSSYCWLQHEYTPNTLRRN